MEYKNNLDILKDIRPSFYKKMLETDINKIPKQIEKIDTAFSRDGNTIAIITKKGKEYRLNSAFRPLEEAERWVQQYKFNNMNNNVTMYGLGNGYFAKAILEQLPENDYLFLYEPCAELFMHVLEHYDLESVLMDKRVIIGVEGINAFDFHKALVDKYQITNLSNSIIAIHPVYDKLFPESLSSFKEEIRTSAMTARIYYNTLLLQARKSFVNIFKNIPKIKDSIAVTQLKEVWKPEVPVILVAAGPSVEDSIEQIRSVKEKAVIVAVDRILDYLLNKDIKPDFVVTLDPRKNVNNFTKRESVDIPLFCVMQAQPLIMDKQKGKKIICWSERYMLDKYEKVLGKAPQVSISGSVATFAMTILQYLGTKTICVVGQDLAYSGEVTHAGGVISNPNSKESELVDGINGDKVLSRYDWVEYRMWFEDFIVAYPDIKVIDTKSRGALIRGSIIMSLEDALKQYEKRNEDVVYEVNQIAPTFTAEQFVDIRKQMLEEKKELSKIKQKAKEGVGLCSDLINLVKQNKIQSSSIDSKVKKVKEITKYLKENDFYMNLDDMVVQYMKNKYLQVFSTKENEQDNLLNVYDSSRSYFEGVLEAAKFAEPVLQETIEQL